MKWVDFKGLEPTERQRIITKWRNAYEGIDDPKFKRLEVWVSENYKRKKTDEKT